MIFHDVPLNTSIYVGDFLIAESDQHGLSSQIPSANHGAGICTPTFATKSPSFVGKYTAKKWSIWDMAGTHV